MLELARRLHSSPERPAGRGRAAVHRVRGGGAARARRRSTSSLLRSRFGYVFDHASPIGEIVVASPTYYRIVADITGAPPTPGSVRRTVAARSSPPRRGIAAMRLGRLDPETTANVGTIAGGTRDERRARALPDRGRGSERSIRARAEAVATRDGRSPPGRRQRRTRVRPRHHGASGCSRATAMRRRARPRSTLAERALRDCGYEPRQIATGGGSDANALRAAGIRVRSTSPTAPSATTSRPSGSASTRSRGCSRSRSRWSTNRAGGDAARSLRERRFEARRRRG